MNQSIVELYKLINLVRRGKIADNKFFDESFDQSRIKALIVSKPILVLKKAIDDSNMRERLVTIFNDANKDSTNSLETAINELVGIIDRLKYKPQIYNYEVGANIVKMFEEVNLVPTLFFVDPWGYKGLSLRLINSVLKNWGCDCIFFFNYNRISMGLANEKVEHHMDALFGKDRASQIQPS